MGLTSKSIVVNCQPYQLIDHLFLNFSLDSVVKTRVKMISRQVESFFKQNLRA